MTISLIIYFIYGIIIYISKLKRIAILNSVSDSKKLNYQRDFLKNNESRLELCIMRIEIEINFARKHTLKSFYILINE